MVDAREAVLGAVRDARLGSVEHVRPAGAGNRNAVWMVDTSDRQVVVRLLRDEARLHMEVRLLAVAAEAGLPVATCLWSASEPRPVMIQARLPGSRLADIEPPPSLHEHLATLLRQIHGIPIAAGFGNLTAGLRGTAATLPGWFTDGVRSEAAATSMPPDDRRLLDAAVARLIDGAALLSRQEPGLVHGDIQPFNLLVSDGRISGILDWEAAKSGPPAFDFGWWDWWSHAFRTPWSTGQLVDAYDPDGRLDRAEVDAIRELVQIRIWTRELIAATDHHDDARASAARGALLARL